MKKNLVELPSKLHRNLLLLATALGVLFNALFQNSWQLSINYTLLILFIFLVTYFLLRQNPSFDCRVYLAGTLAAMILACYYFLYTNPFFKMVNFVLLPILYGCSILFAYRDRLRISALLRLLFAPLLALHRYCVNFVKALSPFNRLSAPRRNVFIGILISFLLLLLIIPLMISSDQMIDTLLKSWFKDFHFDLSTLLSYLFWFALVASYAYASLYRSLTYPSSQQTDPQQDTLLKPVNLFGRKTAIATVLTVLTIVYALFFALQLFYLAGHFRTNLGADFDYAQYARSGFFQLIALSLINIAILAATFYLLKEEQELRLIKVLLVLFTCLTLALACSSWLRMYLYERTYGYTMLRLLVFLFLYFEIAALLLSLVFICYQRLPIVKIILIAALLYYIVILFCNPEGYVAKKNIDRYYATGKLDTDYLSSLSADAAPQIMRLQEDNNQDVLFLLKQKQQQISAAYTPSKDFRAYNFSRCRADRLYGSLHLNQQLFQVFLQNNSDEDILSFSIASDAPATLFNNAIAAGQGSAHLVVYTPSASYTMQLHFSDGNTHTQTLTLLPRSDRTVYLSVVDEKDGWWIYAD
jgi:hypothetical protein